VDLGHLIKPLEKTGIGQKIWLLLNGQLSHAVYSVAVKLLVWWIL
jgi:hypothetical protein